MLLNNRYQILTTLGSGDLGETYIAKDTHMPSGRLSVVKRLKPNALNQQSYSVALEQFQKEASALETLKHDQIPKIYDYFEWQDEFYLVQERIAGQTLGAKIREGGPFTETETRQFLYHLLPVLSYLHSHNVIHRDIKPDNIILRQQDGKPVAIDFGSVKRTLQTNGQGAAVAYSMPLFSEGFVPPEQAAGRPINYSSDLYSLGMTAIYALTGILPQNMDCDRQTGQIIWRGCAPSISGQLADVLDRAIQLNPSDRLHTAEEMMSALADQQAFASTVFSTPNTQGNLLTAIPLRRRRRSVVSLAVGLAMVLITGAAGAYVYAQSQKQDDPQPGDAADQIAKLYGQGKFAECQASVQKLTAESQTQPQIQTLLNQCRLAEAEQLAAQGNYGAAIAKAKTIPLEASNHQQAKESVANWSAEQQAQEKLALAAKLVKEGKPKEAINTLMQVPKGTKAAPKAWKTIADLIHVDLYNNTMEKEPYLRTPQNRNQAVSINTQFGTSKIYRDWENWPKYQLPTPQERTADPSWDDPWREVYPVVSNQIALEFIYGCRDKNLLQTEVAFNPSVDLRLMQTQLDQMLKGKADKSLHEKLAQVYRGEMAQHRFNAGHLKGVIQRGNSSANSPVVLAVRKA